jgi:DNA-binding MarR family transcriptional regulator
MKENAMPHTDERQALTATIDRALRVVMVALKRGHRHRPADLDLTLGQVNCLRTVGALGEPTMSELSAALGLSPSTVTGLVDTLIQRGQLQRRDDAADRRVVRVRLSAEGVGRQRRHEAYAQKRVADLLHGIDTAGLRQVADALALLVEAVQRPSGEEANQ